MNTGLTLFATILVALVGITGQFVISNRNYIPKIREERALAYSSFLGACLTGIYAVTIEKVMLSHLDNETNQYRPEDENPMRDYIFESLMAYNSELNQHLARLQIIAPLGFNVLGRKIIEEIALVQDEKSSYENLDKAYNNFASRAHADLKSLNEQAISFRSIFRRIKELENEQITTWQQKTG